MERNHSGMIDRSLADTTPGTGRGAASRPLRAFAFVLLAGLGAALAARGQEAPRRAATADDPVVAKVDGRAIRRTELEQRKQRAMEGYREETGRDVPPAFEAFFLRTALEDAVRERLIAAEGRARGIRVSDAAAESVLRQDPMFRPDGKFDPARYEAYKRDNPKSFAQVREEARDFLAFQRRARELERELAPDPATLDRLVERRTDKARVHAVLISEAHFDGRNDPTDEEVRALYARDKESFATPARVSFSTITVSGFEEGRLSATGLARARQRADSLLALVRAGVPFDSLARGPGLLPGRGTWGEGQEGGLFAEAPAWADSAFASPEGRVLPVPFQTLEGWTIARIEQAQPRGVQPLARVANDVRSRWRTETAATRDREEARRFYESHPDSFRATTWVVRWATVDRAAVPVKEAKEADLRAWFEARRNTFTRLDPSGGGVRLLSFEEARREVEARYEEEQREAAARALADRVATAWAAGKSGPGKAQGMIQGGPSTLVQGVDPPPGLRLDLADTLRTWTRAPRALVVPDPAGYAVIGLVRLNENERPPFEAIETQVNEAVARQRAAEERAAARAWFEQNRGRFETGVGYALLYALSPPPVPARVDVPAAAIEREYRTNIGAYTPPLESHVRHILFMTDRRTPAEATTLARAARGRLARGEDFVALAREISEDATTRAQGGDLGFLRAGETVPEFEQAVQALTDKAPLSGPVTTPYGVHLIQLVERRGGVPEPLARVRGQVTQKVVAQYSDTLSREDAERLRRESPDLKTMLERAETLRMPTAQLRWYEGFPMSGPAVLDELRADAAKTPIGRLLPRVYRYQEQGYVVAAIDTVLPSRPLSFEEGGERVLAEYRREMRLAAARARAAKVEADLAAGRSWTEATETLGGSVEPYLIGADEPLPGYGVLPGVDSLLFGPAPIPVGGRGRAETPRGSLVLQVTERVSADAAARARERENVRRALVARRLYDHVEGLRSGARIEVLRADLADRPPAPPKI
jgi:parvulin-like peptidyl-prolyl isomerase